LKRNRCSNVYQFWLENSSRKSLGIFSGAGYKQSKNCRCWMHWRSRPDGFSRAGSNCSRIVLNLWSSIGGEYQISRRSFYTWNAKVKWLLIAKLTFISSNGLFLRSVCLLFPSYKELLSRSVSTDVPLRCGSSKCKRKRNTRVGGRCQF